ncbi:MAG: glycosyltransferase family 2 protein [Rhodospirillales bacterium]|nr:glycosyltransferase family 2 protein [Rhodospirillales bacterium]
MTSIDMRVSVIIASRHRAEEVGQLLNALAQQSKLPTKIVLSVSEATDLPPNLPSEITVVTGPPGLPAQRNRGLDLIQDKCEIIIFYDDDFLPSRSSIEEIAEFFSSHPDVVGATGQVLADGINGPGLSYPEALNILAAYEAKARPPLVIEDFLCAYGCNMAFRCAGIGTKRFDEKLPRYAWQEDMDFAGQIATAGKVLRTNAFAGVHRGIKKGRGQGLDLGFSQIVNPVYLVRKGTMTRRKALTLMSRNIVANHVKVFRPEPYVDRWGRLRGNWVGLLHLLHGKADPMALPTSRA